MAELLYQPLNDTQGSIRLLQISKGWGREEISCSLFQTVLVLDENQVPDRTLIIPYIALSYVWGREGFDHQILINNHPFMVKPNLFSALQHIRRTDQDVILWVDAICINQRDKKERGHQVAQMRYVYEAAEEVFIWLGKGDEETSNLIKAVHSIDEKAKRAGPRANYKDWTKRCEELMPKELGSPGSPLRSERSRSLGKLLKNKWFERVWILQEIARAKTAKIICGNSSCPARTFSFIPHLMDVQVDEHVQSVLDIMPRIREGTWWSSTRNLHHLIREFSGSQASMNRDKVYALLSMSEDAHDSKRFFPCYEKDDSRVWRDTVSFLIFGEILSQDYSFPEFAFSDLRRPVIELVEQTLEWAVTGLGFHQGSLQKTAEILVRRLNEGDFKKHEVLESLARKHGQEDKMHELVSKSDYHIDIELADAQTTLIVIPEEPGMDSVVMAFYFLNFDNDDEDLTLNRRELSFENWLSSQGEILQRRIPKDNQLVMVFKKRDLSPVPLPESMKFPPFRFGNNEDMLETINNLVRKNAPPEELLWAHTWVGNEGAVRELLEGGISPSASDDKGYGAVHLAALKGHTKVLMLLIKACAYLDQRSVEHNTALHFAAARGLLQVIVKVKQRFTLPWLSHSFMW
ncbi:het-domain-containing protein [Fusarium flagelliforme]|uniref:Het-domain-containing protein n=1 Tax=Fusarium flagelliforme TaxID=2675880 RepID=A0A395MWP8_9HYPO|nr:het-domain-containing protein [Fusarium flagelliforme]